jgi:diaminohydroxyphosphoribosylaminopyrimidine deaminase / 5-amino-6-(5-phosphoribosylamino)uracil reductase
MNEADRRFMRAALVLARRGLGTTWPNPSVGCVLVRDGAVAGRGWTQPGGRPHAETVALAQAGEAARGATAYVTLEPCSHHGKTPPCADALIAAGIARAVVACEDPDPRVSGRGVARLRAAGIAVETGVRGEEAWDLNLGFFTRVQKGRPLVTLKLATTLDARIATAAGESQWITGPEARAWGHRLRAEHDAILIGSGTALADDPDLTCRLPGLEHRSPVRVVFDGRLRLPPESRLARSAGTVPVWVVCRDDSEAGRVAALSALGVTVLPVLSATPGPDDAAAALRTLGERGLTRVLAEGGAGLATSLLRAGAVDRIEWFRAASLIGGDGLPAVGPLGLDRLAEAPRFRLTGQSPAGADTVSTFIAET